MKSSLSTAYDLIQRVAGSSGSFTADDMADLAQSSAGADSELSDDWRRFSEAIEMVEKALSSEERRSVGERVCSFALGKHGYVDELEQPDRRDIGAV